MGARKNRHTSERRAPVLSCVHYFQAPATQAMVVASGVISGTVEYMIVGVNVVLNRTVVESDRHSTTAAVIIFKVKVTCITSVDRVFQSS